jgi:hypothetical protein
MTNVNLAGEEHNPKPLTCDRPHCSGLFQWSVRLGRKSLVRAPNDLTDCALHGTNWHIVRQCIPERVIANLKSKQPQNSDFDRNCLERSQQGEVLDWTKFPTVTKTPSRLDRRAANGSGADGLCQLSEALGSSRSNFDQELVLETIQLENERPGHIDC